MDGAPRTASDASETDILDRILPVFEDHRRRVSARGRTRTLLGPGDDAAAYDLGGGVTVLSTDTQTEGQDYLMHWPCGVDTRGFDLGWKSAAQNLVDIAAMGADPVSLVVSLSIPGTVRLDFLEDMAHGYVAAIEALGAEGCAVDGGDLGGGTEFSATVAALGLCERPVPRSGAQPGDVVVLAGTVGRAAAGLALLTSPEYRPGRAIQGRGAEHARAVGLDALAATQLRPCPPLPDGPRLAAAGARAMIDVSDGLVRDAGRLARASDVSIRLHETELEELARPLREAGDALGEDPTRWLIAGGEDHGLLAVLPAGSLLPSGVVEIGSCGQANRGEPSVTVDGRAPEDVGWDHFGAQDRI